MKQIQMNHKQRLRLEFRTALRKQGTTLTEAKNVGYKDNRVLLAIGYCLTTYPVSFHRDDITDILCITLYEYMARKAKETFFMARNRKQAA